MNAASRANNEPESIEQEKDEEAMSN